MAHMRAWCSCSRMGRGFWEAVIGCALLICDTAAAAPCRNLYDTNATPKRQGALGNVPLMLHVNGMSSRIRLERRTAKCWLRPILAYGTFVIWNLAVSILDGDLLIDFQLTFEPPTEFQVQRYAFHSQTFDPLSTYYDELVERLPRWRECWTLKWPHVTKETVQSPSECAFD